MSKLLALAALLAAATAASADYPPILNLHMTDSTLNTVTLAWTLDVSGFVPETYTLHVDGILTIQFFHDGTFTYTVTGLQSCHQYQFDLTANYAGGDGPTADLRASTLYETPGPVQDLRVDGSVVSWKAPANDKCVQHYTVCHTSTVTEDSGCLQGLISTSIDLGTMSACDELDVTVYAIAGNLTGPPSTVHVITPDGVPGTVRDLEVTPLTDTSVLLAWNPPLVNPACCVDTSIVYGPETNFTVATECDESEEEEEGGMAKTRSDHQENAILDNLFRCTDYRFGVACVTKSNVYGGEEVVYLSTNESAPGMLPNVVFDPSDDSITISWGDVSAEACLGHIQICYVDPVDHIYTCVEVPSSPNTWTVDGLGACREYEFRITGMSPDGLPGEPIVITVPTLDRAPGPVQNLTLSHVEMTSLTVTYDAPIEYPECVDQYIVTYKNILDEVDTRSAGTRAGSFTADIDGLEACAIYEIGVAAVSPSGLVGPFSYITTPMKQGVPEPPSSAQQVAETGTSLTVLWYAPSETRFCVDTYEVRVSVDGSGPSQLVPVLDFNQELLETFTGLNPCTAYKVQIRTHNSDTSSASAYATVLSDANTVC